MKPWVIAAVLIALLAGGALLYVRSERPGDERPVPGGPARTVAMPGRDPRAPPVSAGQRSPASMEPAGVLKTEVVASAAAARSPVGTEVDWEAIPLDRAGGESLGDVETRRAFAVAMRQPPALSRCTEEWAVPPGIRRLDIDIELRVRSVDDALVVEDVRVLEANVSDARVERCVVEGLRGRRAHAPGIRPGQAFRLKWAASKTVR